MLDKVDNASIEDGSYEGARPLEAVRQPDGRIVALVHNVRGWGTGISIGNLRAILVPAKPSDFERREEDAPSPGPEWLAQQEIFVGHTQGYMDMLWSSFHVAALFADWDLEKDVMLHTALDYDFRAVNGVLFVRQRGIVWLSDPEDGRASNEPPADPKLRRSIEAYFFVNPKTLEVDPSVYCEGASR